MQRPHESRDHRTTFLFAVAGLLTLSQLGRFSPTLDLLNVVAEVWWPLLLIATLLWAARPLMVGRRPTLLQTAPLLLTLLAATNLWFDVVRGVVPSPGTATDAGRRLRLVSFNMNRVNPDPEAVLRWLDEVGADVVVLLESRHAMRSSPRLATQFPHAVDCAGKTYGEVTCTTAVLSRLPVLEARGLARADANNRKGLSAAQIRFVVGKHVVTLVGAHLARPYQPLQRKNLAELVFAIRQAAGSGPLVVAGDFNLSPTSFRMKRFMDETGLSRAPGLGPTWPAHTLSPNGALTSDALPLPAVLSLDHVLVGGRFLAAQARMGPSLSSDHVAVVTDLYLPR